MIDRQKFFAKVRKSLFGGSLTQTQVSGLNAILDAGEGAGLSMPELAYVLATPTWEVGKRLAPVREGFAATDSAARAAVAKLYAKGRISRNYALPAGPYGLSYYGRGYDQLTHLENYQKASEVVGIDLVANPDRMLEPEVAAKEMVDGMISGRYRGYKLADYRLPEQFYKARDIINGDKAHRSGKRKIGDIVAGYAKAYLDALT